jgi:hypothetical protein
MALATIKRLAARLSALRIRSPRWPGRGQPSGETRTKAVACDEITKFIAVYIRY